MREKELVAERAKTLTLPAQAVATPTTVMQEQHSPGPVSTPNITTNATQESAKDTAKRDVEREVQKAMTVEPVERAVATPTTIKQERHSPGPVLTPDIITNATQEDAEDIAKRAAERAVATLSNSEREQHGLSPLHWDSALADIARSHSKDMAANSYFDHRNKQGENTTQRGLKAGYRCVSHYHRVG